MIFKITKRRFMFIFRILTIIFIIIMAVQILAFIIPILAGYKTYAVLTPSMHPALKVGSLICVKEAEAEDIREGDICTFLSLKYKNKRYTHRVISVDKETKTFITRGDNNVRDDPEPVSYNRLVGKVRHVIPFAGIFVYLLQSYVVKIIMIFFMILWLAVEIELFRNKRAKTNRSISG